MKSNCDYSGLRVTILGVARQGVALARFMLRCGAAVTLSDQRPADALESALRGLEDFARAVDATPPTLAAGGHPPELLDQTDLLLLSGGVPPAIPIVQEARRRGISVSNDGALTLRHCPAPIIGITGSAGKTTTTTLTGLILEAGGFRVHVGGNIGTPLIDRLDQIKPGDKVVMELSSFQLELMNGSPAIAGLLNITPNHLDRHPSMSHYAAAKTNVLRFQNRGDTAVLNADDGYTGAWLHSGRVQVDAGEGQEALYFPLQASLLSFSLAHEVAAGAFMQDERLVLRREGLPDAVICNSADMRLRGRHNRANMLAAAALASAAGAGPAEMAHVATTFTGVEHRLEIVRQRDGVLWINDSIATAPERTVADIRSFDEPLVLLLGGRDKHLPWDECAAQVHRSRVRKVILFGEAAALIADALSQHARRAQVTPVSTARVADLAAAVAEAARSARPGDVVLLAPGGTSFDQYEDFAARGQHFRDLVENLP